MDSLEKKGAKYIGSMTGQTYTFQDVINMLDSESENLEWEYKKILSRRLATDLVTWLQLTMPPVYNSRGSEFFRNLALMHYKATVMFK